MKLGYVTLDALAEETFRTVCDVDFPVSRVLEGILNAQQAGFKNIKVNAVIKRGLNEHSVLPLARYFHGTGSILRFIEYMDVGSTNNWKLDEVVSASERVATINQEMPIEPLFPNYRGEVAKRWRYADGGGEVGFITSVTESFCGDSVCYTHLTLPTKASASVSAAAVVGTQEARSLD